MKPSIFTTTTAIICLMAMLFFFMLFVFQKIQLDWVVSKYKPTCQDFESRYPGNYTKAYTEALKSYVNDSNKKLDGPNGVREVPCESLYRKASQEQMGERYQTSIHRGIFHK